MKTTRKQANNTAAVRIANTWAAGAENALSNGLTPSPLSDEWQLKNLINGQYEEGEILCSFAYSDKHNKAIAVEAVAHAKWLLREGRFPLTFAHFSKTVASPASSVPAPAGMVEHIASLSFEDARDYMDDLFLNRIRSLAADLGIPYPRHDFNELAWSAAKARFAAPASPSWLPAPVGVSGQSLES